MALSSPSPAPSTDSAGLALSGALAEYLSLSDCLKRLPGSEFETHDHPAVVLDRATGPSTQVWGWWADDESTLPCLVWRSARGWSAAVVEPDELDSEGYERPSWTHRVKLLDLALATAIGPCATIAELESQVAADGSFGFGENAEDVQMAVLSGLVRLRATHAGHGSVEPVELEDARRGLVPTRGRTGIFARRRRQVSRGRRRAIMAQTRALDSQARLLAAIAQTAV
jgi:hypothetical protein